LLDEGQRGSAEVDLSVQQATRDTQQLHGEEYRGEEKGILLVRKRSIRGYERVAIEQERSRGKNLDNLARHYVRAPFACIKIARPLCEPRIVNLDSRFWEIAESGTDIRKTCYCAAR